MGLKSVKMLKEKMFVRMPRNLGSIDVIHIIVNLQISLDKLFMEKDKIFKGILL